MLTLADLFVQGVLVSSSTESSVLLVLLVACLGGAVGSAAVRAAWLR